MDLTADAIMERQVLSVSPDTPLLDVHRLFVEEQIHGAPVVSDDGLVLGVVSSGDLLKAVYEEHDSGRGGSEYFRELLEFSGPDWSNMPGDFQDRLRDVRVSDCMSPDVVSVASDASVSEIAQVMRANRIHRVLVVHEDQLVGIITSFDLVALLEKADHG